jgi:S-adenosylmethionine:tRNA ribosyltransferase-isomerase
MRLEEFDYDLPSHLVAQEPLARREASRLMVLDRAGTTVSESTFESIGAFLDPGDLLILNDTRVRPARLHGRRPTGGRVELLLVSRDGTGGSEDWSCIMSNSRGMRPGARIAFSERLEAEVLDAPNRGRIRVRFHSGDELPEDAIRRQGVMPLPPYIRRDPDDARAPMDHERYQTVYAAEEGAIAAPTAGLHFTSALLESLAAGGIDVARLTLHVGPGTFLPLRCELIEEHSIEAEAFSLPIKTAAAVARCRAAGGRVVAVGTTVTRVLESRVGEDGRLQPGEGWCELYIHPGFRFRVVDALITNLHLPRSSLLILVAALAGRDRILAAYREAVRRRFRFYSYGDAMLIR